MNGKHAPVRTMVATFVCVVLLFGATVCRRLSVASPPGPFWIERLDSIDAVARAYVRVAIALGERDPDSLDFAVVPAAESASIHKSYPTLEAIDIEAARILAQLDRTDYVDVQQDRARYIALQLRAIQARIRMLHGGVLPFVTEARVLFNVEPLVDVDEEDRAGRRRQIASALGTPFAKSSAGYATYDRKFLVSPDRLEAVMRAALNACRQQTVNYLSLPPNESVDLIFIRNRPWSAFSHFEGNAHSTIAINVGFPLTVDQVLELACHEGYPGHHVFNTLHEIAEVQQKKWPEAELQPTFSPQSYLSESAAAFAPRLAFSLAERIRVERDVLFPLAGLPLSEAEQYVTISGLVRGLATAEPRIAAQYLDGELEFVRAAQRLREETLMEHPEATLLYLNEYRSYMLAYTAGPRRVAEEVGFVEGRPALEDNRGVWNRYRKMMEGVSAR